MRGPSALRAMRTSTSAQAWAGITLVFVPPRHRHAYREAALEVGPAAHRFDHARQFAEALGALFEVHAGMSGDACTSMRQSPVPLRAVL